MCMGHERDTNVSKRISLHVFGSGAPIGFSGCNVSTLLSFF